MASELVKEIEDRRNELQEYIDEQIELVGAFPIPVDTLLDTLNTLQRAREALQINRLEKKVVAALVKKLTVNTYGTDKQCKEAFRELWKAFDELEAYENDRERNTESDTLDCS